MAFSMKGCSIAAASAVIFPGWSTDAEPGGNYVRRDLSLSADTTRYPIIRAAGTKGADLDVAVPR
jgi:hypothetical protein